MAAVALLAACGSSGGGSSTSGSGSKSAAPAASGGATLEAGASCKSSSATKITFWAWLPGMGRAVTEFNKTHPGICVTPHLTVAENIGFSLENKKIPKTERQRRVRDTAAILGLTGQLNRKPRQLSGGQKQRVAMGRAIVREPAIFLMDEPLSSLDAKLRVQMRAEMLAVHRRIGAATLYVTHDQTEAMTLGDRVAVLSDGELQQVAAPRALYDRPVNLFVATFIGSPSMNLYLARLDIVGDTAELILGSQRLTLPPAVVKQSTELTSYNGAELIVGIRPESLSLADHPRGPAPAAAAASARSSDREVPGGRPPGPTLAGAEPGASLTAEVELVEVLGTEQLVHFQLDARRIGDGVGVARVDLRARIQPHGRTVLAVDTERLHFFDPATGAAIH
ncbi:MAG TPA: ATP-binding cassette domain-containing protein [Streptosporangiaceae bacterium]